MTFKKANKNNLDLMLVLPCIDLWPWVVSLTFLNFYVIISDSGLNEVA